MPPLPLKTQHKYAAMKDEKCIQAVCVCLHTSAKFNLANSLESRRPTLKLKAHSMSFN